MVRSTALVYPPDRNALFDLGRMLRTFNTTTPGCRSVRCTVLATVQIDCSKIQTREWLAGGRPKQPCCNNANNQPINLQQPKQPCCNVANNPPTNLQPALFGFRVLPEEILWYNAKENLPCFSQSCCCPGSRGLNRPPNHWRRHQFERRASSRYNRHDV